VDLERLSAATRKSGAYLVVDAIQAVGQLPVDVSRVEVDLLACGAQKWLLSPWGSGFVYVRRELIARLDPVITGWLAFEGTDDLSRLTSYDDTLRADARRFELMTLPYQDFAGFNSSLDLILELRVETIRDHPGRPASAGVEPNGRRGVASQGPERLRHPVRVAGYRRLKASRSSAACASDPPRSPATTR
jgi:selenocysteine lyase/cysteine desulfurase